MYRKKSIIEIFFKKGTRVQTLTITKNYSRSLHCLTHTDTKKDAVTGLIDLSCHVALSMNLHTLALTEQIDGEYCLNSFHATLRPPHGLCFTVFIYLYFCFQNIYILIFNPHNY